MIRGSRGDVLHHEVVGGDRAEADRVGRVAVARPVPALPRPVQQLLLLEVLQDLDEALPPESLVAHEGQLEGRALDVVDEDLEVVGVDAALLDGRPEEVVRVLRDELVEGGRVGDEDGDRGARPPPRPSRLLPGRGHAAGVAHEHRGVEAPDVDPELQRVRGDDAEDRSLAEPPLDRAALERQVAAPVAPDDPLGPRPRLQGFLQVRDQHLGGEPRRGEDDRLEALREEGQRDVARGVEGRLADAELTVHDRRVVDREVPLAARGAAPVHERHLALGEGLGELPRVADRGRRADELRPRAVELAQPPQPPEDVRDVRAVDPAQAVQLVHHHVAQVLEELHPLRVVGQDPLVQHVGVRHHDVGPGPDRLPRVLRGVPVVGERPDVGPDRLDHPVELRELVLGQRLRREEVEGPRVRVLEDAVEDGQVVAERLARGGRGDDHDVPARPDVLVRLALVGVEARVPAPPERLPQRRVQVLREVHDLGRLGREVPERGEDGLRAERLLDLEALQHGEKGPLAVGAGQGERLAQGGILRPPTRGGACAVPRIMREGVATGGPECGNGLFFRREASE